MKREIDSFLKLKKKGFDWKDTERFDKTASEVGGALGNLESQIHTLKGEIKADEQGIFDFDARLGFLYKENEFHKPIMRKKPVLTPILPCHSFF